MPPALVGVDVSGDLERFSGDERAGANASAGLASRESRRRMRALAFGAVSGLSASERLRGAGWPGRVALAEQDAPEP